MPGNNTRRFVIWCRGWEVWCDSTNGPNLWPMVDIHWKARCRPPGYGNWNHCPVGMVNPREKRAIAEGRDAPFIFPMKVASILLQLFGRSVNLQEASVSIFNADVPSPTLFATTTTMDPVVKLDPDQNPTAANKSSCRRCRRPPRPGAASDRPARD